MAAVLPGEESALPGNGSRLDRNGIGVIYCFICGGSVTSGKELKLQVQYQRENGPFFPFLQHQEPAPGADAVSLDGCVLACAVCHCFLGEQWNSFERSRTPIEKRMYWLKRPYQCDSRRIPQEWNISYDLERRISVSSQNFDGAESDFSSFSENDMSDQELDSTERPGTNKEKCFKISASSKTSKEGTRKSNSVKSSPDSQRGIRYTVGGYAAQDLQKSESTLPLRRSAQIMTHVSQSSVSLAQFQEFLPQRCYDTPSVATPVRDNGLIIRDKQWLSEENVKHPDLRQHTADSSCNSRNPLVLLRKRHKAADVAGATAALSPAGARGASDAHLPKESDPCKSNDGVINHACDSDSDGNEINITSDDDVDTRELPGGRHERAVAVALSRQQRQLGSVLAQPHSSGAAEECVCYICGSQLSQTSRFRVYVQKQERTVNEPFFPFLWLHSPPPGSVPLSPGGCTLVCACCHGSLMQQWQGFELASVPVLQRLYVVPLNADGGGPQPPEGRKPDSEPEQSREACFLCGQDCGKDVKVAYAKAGPGKARSAMHFPFLSLLPCPPNARSAKNGKVHCCRLCHGILEDIWAAYRLCMSEDLIASVNTFLARYHLAVGGGAPASQGGCLSLPAAHSAHASVCYLCGAELGAGAEFQLNVNPPGRCGEGEPFFPFLTVHPPAPGAKPPDSTGLVSTCVLCYHDLLGQWARHEGPGGQPASSPWARQYSCATFVCFFCRQEKRRCLGLQTVHVARLPVFLYAPRVSHTLVVDDGKKLTIASCVECKTMVLAGQNMKQNDSKDGDPSPGKRKVTAAPFGDAFSRGICFAALRRVLRGARG